MTFSVNLSPFLPNTAFDRLHRWADAAMCRPPDEIIGDRYLRRWHSTKSPLCSLYLHLYVGDDPATWLHDHPWPSFSLCLRGVILETRQLSRGLTVTSAINPGTLSYRPARFAHRLGLASAPAVTIFLTGPHLREWGWHLPGGWRHWRAISSVDPDGITRVRNPGPRRELPEDTP